MMQVVEAQIHDLPDVCSLRRQLALSEAETRGEVLSEAGWLRVYAEVYNSFADGLDTWLLAVDGEKTVGFMRIVWSPLIGLARACRIEGVYVRPESRKTRAMGLLRRELLRCVEERGHDTIQGYALAGNEHKDLWLKRGAEVKAIVMEYRHGRRFTAGEAVGEGSGSRVQSGGRGEGIEGCVPQ